MNNGGGNGGDSVAPLFASTSSFAAAPSVDAAALVAVSAMAFAAIDQLYEDAAEDNVPV